MRRRTIGLVVLAAAIVAAAAVSIHTRRPRRLWRTEAETAAIMAASGLQWASAAFAAKNGGYFAEPECLFAPASCLPGYEGPPFLEAAYDAAARHAGYQFTFHPGRPASDWKGDAVPTYPDSLLTFALVAVPRENTWYGPRSVCADNTLRVCVSTSASFDTSDGMCPRDCTRMDPGR